MSEKRLYSYDKGNNKILCNLNDVCDFNVFNVFQLLNSLAEENEQLREELDNFRPVLFQDIQGTVILYSKGDIDEFVCERFEENIGRS